MKAQLPLHVSLHGMNNRMQSMMAAYLQLNCQNIACVVTEEEADAEIVDLDSAPSSNILTERLTQEVSKPIIALSLYDISSKDEAIHIKKPIKADDLIDALYQAKKKVTDSQTTLRKEIKADIIPSSTHIPLPEKTPEIKQLSKKIETKEKKVTTSSSIKKASNLTNNKVAELKTSIKMGTELQKNEWKKPKQEIDKKASTLSNSAFPSHYVKEIDRFLTELNQKKTLTPRFVPDTRRGVVRYMLYQKIKAQLISSVFGVNQSFPIVIQVISSKGALIESDKRLKPKKKLTLKIRFDAEHTFTIHTLVVRKNSAKTYGLAFSEFQHEMTEYLISSGRSFDIKDDKYAR